MTLWARNGDVVAEINGRHTNSVYLPGVTLNPALTATTDLATVAALDLVLLVTPAQQMRTSLPSCVRR